MLAEVHDAEPDAAGVGEQRQRPPPEDPGGKEVAEEGIGGVHGRHRGVLVGVEKVIDGGRGGDPGQIGEAGQRMVDDLHDARHGDPGWRDRHQEIKEESGKGHADQGPGEAQKVRATDDPQQVADPQGKGEVQEVEHRGANVVPVDLTDPVQRMLEGQRRHLAEADQPLERGHVVDRHPNLATQAAQVLVGQEEHEEGDPVGKEALAATKHQGGDQHQDQEPFGGHREVKDEHHEEGDGGQVPAHDRWNQPGPAPGLAHRCIRASLRNRIPHAIGWQLRPS